MRRGRVYTDPFAYYLAMKAALERMKGAPKDAIKHVAQTALADWRDLLSGEFSEKDLAALGHPYARLTGLKQAIQAANTSGGDLKGIGKRMNAMRGTGRRTRKARAIIKSKGRAPLLPVNKQSGKLYNSLKAWEASSQPLKYKVGPTASAGSSRWAVVKGGTRRVVPRGVQREVIKRSRASSRAFRDVFGKAFTGT